MAKYILKRILYILLVFLVLSFVIYLLYNMIPVDKAYNIAKTEAEKSPELGAEYLQERYQYWQRYYGLDGNLIQRYLRWMGLYPFTNTDGTVGKLNGLLQGSFGVSIDKGKTVIELIAEPMQNTIFMNVFATILALGITIPLGIFCAVKRGSKRDTAVRVGTVVGYSIPSFIIAILFIWLFAVVLKIFPVSGMGTPGNEYTGFRALLDRMYYLALPLIVMTFTSLGGMTRYVRAAMIEALSMDCIRTARAKGVKEKVVIYSHAWRNALLPIIILIIGWFLSIFSGSIVIENIFAYNGIGKVYYDALNSQDNEVVLALQMFYVLIALIGNLIVDITYGFVDPRVRVSK